MPQDDDQTVVLRYNYKNTLKNEETFMSASQSDKDKKQTGTKNETAAAAPNSAAAAADSDKTKQIIRPFAFGHGFYDVRLDEEDREFIDQIHSREFISLANKKLLVVGLAYAKSRSINFLLWGAAIQDIRPLRTLAIIDLATATISYRDQKLSNPKEYVGVVSVSPHLYGIYYIDSSSRALKMIQVCDDTGAVQFEKKFSTRIICIAGQVQIRLFPKTKDYFVINTGVECWIIDRKGNETCIQPYQPGDKYVIFITLNSHHQLTVFFHEAKKNQGTRVKQFDINISDNDSKMSVNENPHTLIISLSSSSDQMMESSVRDNWWIRTTEECVYYREENEMKSISIAPVKCFAWLPDGSILGYDDKENNNMKIYQIKISSDNTLVSQLIFTNAPWDMKSSFSSKIDPEGNWVRLTQVDEGIIRIRLNVDNIKITSPEIQTAVIAATAMGADTAKMVAEYVGVPNRYFFMRFPVSDREDISDDFRQKIIRNYTKLMEKINHYKTGGFWFRFTTGPFTHQQDLEQKKALKCFNELLKDKNLSIAGCVKETRKQFPEGMEHLLDNFPELKIELDKILVQEEKQIDAASKFLSGLLQDKKLSVTECVKRTREKFPKKMQYLLNDRPELKRNVEEALAREGKNKTGAASSSASTATAVTSAAATKKPSKK